MLHTRPARSARLPGAGPLRRVAGFTLIELMIAVVVVAVLAAVALPTFFDQIRKSRRSEAFTAISAVQQAQERWRSNSANYSDEIVTELKIPSTTTSPGGYYTLAVTLDESTKATTYIVSATAVAGTSQSKDKSCAKLAARVAGGQITYAGCESCSTFSFSESNRCWSR